MQPTPCRVRASSSASGYRVDEMISAGGSDEWSVWLGRFQPFHSGHLGFLRSLLEETGLPLMIGVIVSTEGSSLLDDYGRLAAAQHVSAKNPLALWERLTMIGLSLEAHGLSDSVRVLGVPRPDDDIELVKRFLPARRTMCYSDKDQFEILKAARWKSSGETVRIIHSGDGVSATHFKAVLRGGGDWAALLTPESLGYFWSIDGPERFRQAE